MFAPQKVKQGVRTPIEEAGNEEGTPNTVRRIAPIDMVAVEYFDKSGQRHETVVLSMGGKIFVPPNGEQWLFECKAAAAWLERAIHEHLDRARPQADKPKAQLPDKDAVDVLAPVGT